HLQAMESNQSSAIANIELLSTISQQMWRETSFDKLLMRFFVTLETYINKVNVATFVIRPNDNTFVIEATEPNLKGLARIEDDIVQALRSELSKVNLKSPETRTGQNLLHCSGRDIYFAL